MKNNWKIIVVYENYLQYYIIIKIMKTKYDLYGPILEMIPAFDDLFYVDLSNYSAVIYFRIWNMIS